MPIPTPVLQTGADAPVTVALAPVHNAIYSLLLLVRQEEEQLSGIGDWVTTTLAALSPETRQRHKLVLSGLHYALLPDRSWSSFPAYLEHLATCEPLALQDKVLNAYARFPRLTEGKPYVPGNDPAPVNGSAVLKDPDSYLAFLRTRFHIDVAEEDIEREAYRYLTNPPAMRALIVSHLQEMWDRHLASEWRRVEPMLSTAVQAFQQLDLKGMSKREAAQRITGQTLDEATWAGVFDETTEVILIPSAHVGPYLGRVWTGSTRRILFGARLPAGAQVQAPDLSRAEIAVRLNALADDTRLQILKYIADQGEVCSQEIIAELGLSQSTASRHLNHLSATRYLTERREGSAKCYTLNPQRLADTLRALNDFLLGE